MKEIYASINKWKLENKPFAMARVIKTWRSSPRPAGSTLLVSNTGEMIGSVSGGCVENAVFAKALEVLESGKPETVTYGVADEDAWEVGLSCGGALSVHIAPFFNDADWGIIQTYKLQKKGLVVLTELKEGGLNLFIDPTIENKLSDDLNQALQDYYKRDLNGVIQADGIEYFCHVFAPKKQMLLIGSAHITSEMISLAEKFDFETIVIDPRDTFAKKTIYDVKPDQLHVKWPQEILPDLSLDRNMFAVILSHDPKIDDEALKILIDSEVSYIGALGSKRSHAKRVDRLKEYGFTEQQIDFIHAPIGIPINSLSPKEIALSVMAEVIKVKNER